MLEARLNEAAILKRLLDSIKELVADANFECNEEGIELQAMDNSHVALVAVKMRAEGFKRYRCDRPMPLGVNLTSLTKVLKCAKDDDIVILKAADDADVLGLTYEARSTDCIAEYALKLMDIDSDTLGIPDTDYDARVTMPSAEFARIVRDLSSLGESVRIDVTKEGVRFVSEGEAANGSVLLKHNEAVGGVKKGKKVKKEDQDDNNEEDEDDGEKKVKKEKVKKEKKDGEDGDDDEDGDVEMNEDDDEYKDKDASDGGEDAEDAEDEGASKKRKRAKGKAAKSSKRRKASPSSSAASDASDDEDKEDGGDGGADLPDDGTIRIELNAAVALTFSLKYLVNFAKSAALSGVVQLMMSNDVPLLVSFEFGQGYIRYYLAPKIGDD